MKKNKFAVITFMLLFMMLIGAMCIMPAGAYVMNEENMDTSLFETTIDMQDYSWYRDINTTYSNTTLNGEFFDKNGTWYDISINGTAATINGIVPAHGVKTIVIPKYINLYTIEITDEGKGSPHLNITSKHDKNVYRWESTFTVTEDGIVYDNYARVITSTFTVVSIENSLSSITNTVEEIILPDSIEYMGSGAVSNNVFLQKIYMPGVKRIDDYAFGECRALEYVYVPNLLYMGNEVFYDCYALKTFDFGKILNVGDNAFYNCTSLIHIDLPVTLQSLGRSVFYKCENLTTVTITSGIAINTIESSTFAHCTSLEKITIPNEIVILESNAFEHCDKLKTIDLTNTNIANIKSNTFFGCLTLQYALLPETLLSFDTSAFDSCSSLRYVYFAGELTENQVEDINVSELRGKAITKRDTQGPKAFLYGSKNVSVPKIIYTPQDVLIVDAVDVASTKITHSTLGLIKSSTINTSVNGYRTKASLFTVDKAGTYTITSTDVLGNKSTVVVKYSDAEKLQSSWVTLSSSSYPYTGKAIIPSVNVTGLVANKDYTVSCKNNTAIGTATVTVTGINNYYDSVAKTFSIVPKAPRVSVTTYTTDSISLQWTKDNQATGYRVYKYNPSTKKYETYKTIISNTNTCKISKLSANTSYYFTVKTYKTVGGKNYWSAASGYCKTSTKPNTVAGFKTVTCNNASLKLAWTKVSGATGYRIYKYNPTTKKYEAYKTLTTNTNTYTIAGLKSGTVYYLKIKAYKTINKVSYWGDFSSTLKTATRPSNTSVTLSTPSAGKLTIKWKRMLGATGYTVQYSTSSNFKSGVVTKNITSGNTISTTIAGLQSKKTYFVRIRPYILIGNTKIYSQSYSTVRSLRVK